MQFPGAWIHTDDDAVSVKFTTFDDTDLSSDSEWTEAWQNEDPSGPAGFIHPAMVLAQAARRLLELKPDLAERLKTFEQSAVGAREGRVTLREFQIRDSEQLGLLCLSLCEPILEMTRRRVPQAAPVIDEHSTDEIPF